MHNAGGSHQYHIPRRNPLYVKASEIIPPHETIRGSESLHGEKYWAKPKADVIWNCLFQMGIYADIAVYPMKDERGYPDLETAVSEYADRMEARDQRQKEIIRKYLDSVLVRGANGSLVFPDEGLYAHISWKVDLPGTNTNLSPPQIL
ncbi:MAG: hypothetical protein GX679_08190 [Methanocorpusculum parvum]|nr:hypothetical protein [Methanocorpusculum parvum]